MTTDEKIKQVRAIQMAMIVGDAVRDLRTVPSGHLYAMVMGHMSFELYESIIQILVEAKLVKISAHQLTWIGAFKTENQSDPVPLEPK